MRTTKVISISLPEAQYKKAVRLAKKENRTMSEIVASIHEDSVRNGTDKMTMDEINEEIAAARRELRNAATQTR